MIPLDPTNPALNGNAFGLPPVPTSPAPTNYGVPGPGGLMPAPGQMPAPPTAYPRMPGGYASGTGSATYYHVLTSQNSRLGLPSPGAPPLVGPPLPSKPFAGPTGPFGGSGGYSAYMNLFRQNNGGTIDNYTSLVRPALQQMNINQQVASDVFGLERQNRIQQALAQQAQINYAPRTLQGVGTPEYYMNFGRYQGFANPGGYYGSSYNNQGFNNYGGGYGY